MTHESDVLKLAEQFRFAIESTPKSKLPIGFADFPRGSCTDASIILGVFLFERRCGTFNLVRASRGRMDEDTWGTHAWLTKNELIVDITADQFPEINMPVIATIDSKWHSQFRIDGTNPAHFNTYDARTCAELSRAYHAVIETLDGVNK